MAEKAALRAECKTRERELTAQQRLASDLALQKRFLDLPQLAEAHTVLLFYGMGLEVDTRPLLDELQRQGKRVLLPRCLSGHRMEAREYHPQRLSRHRYGMWEPTEDCPVVEKGDIQLALVPALCYDRRRVRLGRGGGFYDRYLADFNGFTVGLCRDVLLRAELPREDWDARVELVLTETQAF